MDGRADIFSGGSLRAFNMEQRGKPGPSRAVLNARSLAPSVRAAGRAVLSLRPETVPECSGRVFAEAQTRSWRAS